MIKVLKIAIILWFLLISSETKTNKQRFNKLKDTFSEIPESDLIIFILFCICIQRSRPNSECLREDIA